MFRTLWGLALILMFVQALIAQEPKKDLPKGLPTFGDFKSIDTDKKTITVESGFPKTVKSFELADSFTIRATRNTAMLKPTDLAAGDRVALTIDPTSQKVTDIRISRGAAVIEAPRGAFKEVDVVKKTITIDTGESRFGFGGFGGVGGKGEVKSYPLGDSIEFSVGFRKADQFKLNDLIVGDQLSLTLDPESKKVTRISVQAAHPNGTIKSIDLEKKTLVIGPTRGDGPETRWPLGEKVTVEKYFRVIPLSDVKPGIRVSVTLGEDRKTVSRMVISEDNGPRLVLGQIQALDTTKRTITVARPVIGGFGGLKPEPPVTYKIAENAAIKVNGAEGKLTDLATGITIDAFAETDTIIGISVFSFTGRRGTIEKVDVKASTVTIRVFDETITCAITLNTKIRGERKESALADLKEGQEVTFMLSADKKSAESIMVRTSFRP